MRCGAVALGAESFLPLNASGHERTVRLVWQCIARTCLVCAAFAFALYAQFHPAKFPDNWNAGLTKDGKEQGADAKQAQKSSTLACLKLSSIATTAAGIWSRGAQVSYLRNGLGEQPTSIEPCI